MKSRVLIALTVLQLAAVPLALVWLTWNHAHIYPASPETQSAFFKNYTPVNVLNKFNGGQGVTDSGRGSAAGSDSVTHTANFEGDFALCSEQFMPLMDALSDDVAAQLTRNGASIVSQIGLAEAGFHFDYKVGKTLGSVTIAPLQLMPGDPASYLGHSVPVPKCMVTLQARVDVSEKWFAKEPALTQVSENTSIQ